MNNDAGEQVSQNPAPPDTRSTADRASALNLANEMPKSASGWQVASWSVVWLVMLIGLIYMLYQPQMDELLGAAVIGVSDPWALNALNMFANLGLRVTELVSSAWGVLPTDSQTIIVRYRVWLLGALTVGAWFALFYSIYQPIHRRNYFNLRRARQAEQALRSQIAKNYAVTQQVSTMVEAATGNKEGLVKATKLAREAAEVANQSAQKGSVSVRRIMAGLHDADHQIEDSTKHLKQLANEVRQINELVAAVQEGVAQTKLGAINATIRATMAGEVAREFITAAEETQQLADDSVQRASEIAELVQHIERDTNSALDAIQTTAAALEVGLTQANEVGEMLAEIESTSRASLIDIEEQTSVAEANVAGDGR